LSAVAQWIHVINHNFSWTTIHLDIQQQKNNKKISKEKDISKLYNYNLEKRKKEKKEKQII
jgi:hypothetical protein